MIYVGLHKLELNLVALREKARVTSAFVYEALYNAMSRNLGEVMSAQVIVILCCSYCVVVVFAVRQHPIICGLASCPIGRLTYFIQVNDGSCPLLPVHRTSMLIV